jgi:hypothetical protein
VSRAWSLSIPVVTVLVVAYALLVLGAPRPITLARVYGGPNQGLSSWSIRVQTVTREGERESPAWPGPLTVQARTRSGKIERVLVKSAVGGVADTRLSLGGDNRGAVGLEVWSASGARLAGGMVELDGARWAARARQRGGWIRGRDAEALTLSIAPARGAFVVGSSDELWIRVERVGNPVPGARLTVSADGARLTSAPDLVTDARGRAQVEFAASDLNPTVHAEARTIDGLHGTIESGVAVVPGGFHVRRTENGAQVEIAVPRVQAYYSQVTESERVSGGAFLLHPDGQGGSVADLRLAAPSAASWLVVSSDVDEASSATIGWPLTSGGEPARTFDVPDAPLLDGLPEAFAEEQLRRSRVRWLTALFIALSLVLSFVLLVLRVRATDRDLTRHLRQNLEAETVPRVAPERFLPLLVALLAIGLGFALLGLVVLARSH